MTILFAPLDGQIASWQRYRDFAVGQSAPDRGNRRSARCGSTGPGKASTTFPGPQAKMRPIDTMLIVPSKDLRVIAEKHRAELPFAIRALLRGVGGNRPGEDKLLSFLLFEQAYTRELIQLGYRDAMNVKDQLLDFVTGATVPRLFAPDWVRRDLRSLSPG